MLRLPDDDDCSPPPATGLHPALASLCRAIVLVLAALVIASTLVSLSGCGGGGDATDTTVPTPSVLCNTTPPVCT